MKTIYEPHPITPERKAELVARGLKIIDAKFAPAQEAPSAKPKKRRKKDDAAKTD